MNSAAPRSAAVKARWRLSARVANDQLEIARQTMAPDAAPVTVTRPDGKTETVRLKAVGPGRALAQRPVAGEIGAAIRNRPPTAATSRGRPPMVVFRSTMPPGSMDGVVMPTLVAASAAPMNSAVLLDSPKPSATPNPMATGRTTPIVATLMDERPTDRSSPMVSSSPTSSSSRITAVPTSVSVEPNRVTTPSDTSWSSACTSLVRREMITPAWRRE